MISLEALVVVCGWLVSMFVALFIVPKLAAQKTMAKFGLLPVRASDGRQIYAVEGPDGDPIKVPVARADKDGKVTVSDEFVPLAYALPTIAALQTKAFLTSTIQGKAGRIKQLAEKEILSEMPIEQAANAMAIDALMKGQVGKAFMAFLTPKIAQALNQSGNAAREAGGDLVVQRGQPRGRGPI